jgi:glycosyltransferase involved in cell wall biosynthesis
MREAEPFGLVQIEAMMCGTPVAAIGIGAVSEIVEEGITGAISPGPEGFADAVTRAMALDRKAVRERAVERFSTARMARDYVQVYEQLLARRGRS